MRKVLFFVIFLTGQSFATGFELVDFDDMLKFTNNSERLMAQIAASEAVGVPDQSQVQAAQKALDSVKAINSTSAEVQSKVQEAQKALDSINSTKSTNSKNSAPANLQTNDINTIKNDPKKPAENASKNAPENAPKSIPENNIKQVEQPATGFGIIDDGADNNSNFNNSSNLSQPKNINLQFITALAACHKGQYYEINTISKLLGPPMLKHEIVGMNGAVCKVKITTPDNRALNCGFVAEALQQVTDQYFLSGYLSYDVDHPSKLSISAETDWDLIKAKNCSFRL